MNPIRLVKGAGNGIDTACLMTASNMLLGQGDKGDKNSCVCPVLRSFIIPTNDSMPDALRCELYTPLIFEILGTRTDDKEVMQQRAYAFVDWSVREIAPITLEARGFKGHADELRSLPVICDQPSAYAAANAAHSAASAAYAAAHSAASAAASAAYAAANAAMDAESIWRKCPEIIRRVIAIGERKHMECVITMDELRANLGTKCAV